MRLWVVTTWRIDRKEVRNEQRQSESVDSRRKLMQNEMVDAVKPMQIKLGAAQDGRRIEKWFGTYPPDMVKLRLNTSTDGVKLMQNKSTIETQLMRNVKTDAVILMQTGSIDPTRTMWEVMTGAATLVQSNKRRTCKRQVKANSSSCMEREGNRFESFGTVGFVAPMTKCRWRGRWWKSPWMSNAHLRGSVRSFVCGPRRRNQRARKTMEETNKKRKKRRDRVGERTKRTAVILDGEKFKDEVVAILFEREYVCVKSEEKDDFGLTVRRPSCASTLRGTARVQEEDRNGVEAH